MFSEHAHLQCLQFLTHGRVPKQYYCWESSSRRLEARGISQPMWGIVDKFKMIDCLTELTSIGISGFDRIGLPFFNRMSMTISPEQFTRRCWHRSVAWMKPSFPMNWNTKNVVKFQDENLSRNCNKELVCGVFLRNVMVFWGNPSVFDKR